MTLYDEMLEILETLLTDVEINQGGPVVLHPEMVEKIREVVDRAKSA